MAVIVFGRCFCNDIIQKRNLGLGEVFLSGFGYLFPSSREAFCHYHGGNEQQSEREQNLFHVLLLLISPCKDKEYNRKTVKIYSKKSEHTAVKKFKLISCGPFQLMIRRVVYNLFFVPLFCFY